MSTFQRKIYCYSKINISPEEDKCYKQSKLTTSMSGTLTCWTKSIMSNASLAIHLACDEHFSGKPLTAMYLSPTVST